MWEDHLIKSSFLAFSLDNCGEKLSRKSTKTNLICVRCSRLLENLEVFIGNEYCQLIHLK